MKGPWGEDGAVYLRPGVWKDAKDGEIICVYDDGAVIRNGYSKCPKCGERVEKGSDTPRPGDEVEYCIGKGVDEEDGCGWEEVIEHYPGVAWDHADHDHETAEEIARCPSCSGNRCRVCGR